MDEHPLPAVEVSAEGSTVILCVNGTEMCCPAMFNIKIPAPVNTRGGIPPLQGNSCQRQCPTHVFVCNTVFHLLTFPLIAMRYVIFPFTCFTAD